MNIKKIEADKKIEAEKQARENRPDELKEFEAEYAPVINYLLDVMNENKANWTGIEDFKKSLKEQGKDGDEGRTFMRKKTHQEGLYCSLRGKMTQFKDEVLGLELPQGVSIEKIKDALVILMRINSGAYYSDDEMSKKIKDLAKQTGLSYDCVRDRIVKRAVGFDNYDGVVDDVSIVSGAEL